MILPRVFIGSSTESFGIAEALAAKLANTAETKLWSNVFRLGETTIESLLRELRCIDYAVLIATQDDLSRSRGQSLPAPRDNIIFETGLFMGAIGRMRTFLLCDVSLKLKLPSDLAGVTYATFDSSIPNLDESLEPAARKIQSALTAAPRGEIDFLRAYLGLIKPEIKLFDTHAQILDAHLGTLLSEADQLAREENWSSLLELKQRLREYFEFSGRYAEGIKMGRAYVTALRRLDQNEEAAWARIKHLGYMLILSGDHSAGRNEITAALADMKDLPESQSKSTLLFYAYRYLGISHQRDPGCPNIRQARACFEQARDIAGRMAEAGASVSELHGRILRNLGNIESQEGNTSAALNLYQQSLTLFNDVGDQEHVGVTNLAIAQTLIRSGDWLYDPSPYLASAEETFARIGWIEGLGRIHEQYALYWKAKAARSRRSSERQSAYVKGAQHARTACALFERIGLHRMIGRTEALLGELGQKIPGPIA
jgi:tetratricopeptide (TPR) repeat protein